MVADVQVVFELSMLRREAGASEMTLYGSNNTVLATSSGSAMATLPKPLSDEVVLQMQQGRPFVSLESLADGDVEVRTAVVYRHRIGRSREARVIQAHYPVTDRLSEMVNSVERSFQEYQQLVFFREDLKDLLTVTLAFVLLLSLLAAIYGAFVLSRRLVAPIQDLVAGTRAVAMGDFDTRLPAPSRDEIGFLISSFNDMTQRLASARREASLSQALVEAERTNLEVILARLSTGVVALEADLTIRNANQAAGSILGVDLENRRGEKLVDVAGENALLEQFVDVARVHLDAGETEWREQIVLRGEVGRRVLTCACTTLPGDESHAAGYVVVFDDITALLQAQRDAAWGEVARRLAHEIKNLLAGITGAVLLRYLYEQYRERQRELAESRARVQALQARIRPHFLFNSMNPIAALTRSRPETAEEAIQDLADLCAMFPEALVAGAVIAVVCSCLGVFVILKRVVFIGITLSQVAAAGVAVAMVAVLTLWIARRTVGPGIGLAAGVLVAFHFGLAAASTTLNTGALNAFLELGAVLLLLGTMADRTAPAPGSGCPRWRR